MAYTNSQEPANPAPSNLKAYWNFNETAGSTAKDLSGNGNNGTVTGATFTTGVSGNALTFDGASGSVLVSDNAAIQNIFDSGGSISAWINPDSDGEGDFSRIIDKNQVILQVLGESGGSVKVRFAQRFSGDDGIWVTDNTVATIGSWTHIVVTYDNDAVGNDPTIYINGVAVAITESTAPTGTRTTDVGDNLYIGNASSDASTFDGEIDEVRFYDTTLTAAQAKGLASVWTNSSEASAGSYTNGTKP